MLPSTKIINWAFVPGLTFNECPAIANTQTLPAIYMDSSLNMNLPFFSYGIFRPGEISFLGISDFVEDAKKITINGELRLRDGIPLFKTSTNSQVDGFLITFKNEFAKDAYNFIDSLEPKYLFKWKTIPLQNKNFANILMGLKPDRGSEDIKEANWTTIWNDPFFTSAIQVLEEAPDEAFDWEMKSLFRLQMKYMLLWTILERFTFLRYSFGAGPEARNDLFSKNIYLQEALQIFTSETRTIYSAKDPDNKASLDKNDPRKSLKYYYQVRCNITHRGKGVIRDYDTVDKSFKELLDITKYVIDRTKDESQKILSRYDK